MSSIEGIENEGRAPIRIRIGVSGHRHLDRGPTVVAAVRSALATIRERVSPTGTTPVAFTVVSSLAEGTDRLVASTVLEEPGSDLEVLLPLPPEEYEKDFESAASRQEFRHLLTLAKHSQVVSDAERPQAYLDAGEAVLGQVDVLLAVWDGQPSRGVGGTAEIVNLALHEPLPAILVDATSGTVDDRLGAHILPLEVVAELEAYNSRDLSGTGFGEAWERERVGLVSIDAIREDPELGVLVDWMLPFYLRADTAAKEKQQQFFRLGRNVFGLAAAAVTVAATQAVFYPRRGELAWGEVLMLVLGFLFVKYGEHQKVIKRWLWYRSLAERLRSTFYLAASGVREPGEAAAGPADSVDQWILRAGVGVWSATGRPTVRMTDRVVAARRQFLADCWVSGQIAYHEHARSRHAEAHQVFKRNILWVFVLILALAFMHGVLALVSGSVTRHLEQPISRWLSFLTIVLPAWVAAKTGIEELKEHRRYSARSTRVSASLKEAMGPLSKVTDPEELGNMARQIDAIMREDTKDWFGIMSVHEIPPPAG